jgi:hypothetical protein
VSVVQFFLSTANLPFVFALGVSVLFVVLQWSGLLGLLGGGGDADADGDAEGDVDGDADVEADVDGDADGGDADGDADDADADDVDADDAAPAMLRLPLTVRAPVAAIAFAMTGFALNALLYAEAPSVPLLTLVWTLPTGVLSGLVAGKLMARVLAPLLDDRRNAAPERRSLVGRIGTVISTAVSADFGEVRRFYRRCGADEALVRTGSGGNKVVIGGGILVYPILHQLMRVSLRSREALGRAQRQERARHADKIKANVTTELYIKVEPLAEDVLAAARSSVSATSTSTRSASSSKASSPTRSAAWPRTRRS